MILIDALRFRQENDGLLIHEYVMLNSEGKNEILFQLRVCKADYKTTSRHQFWQEGFHPQEIFLLKMLNQKIEYIHDNPVRNNYVENAVDCKYSSAIDYLNDNKGLIEITKVR